MSLKGKIKKDIDAVFERDPAARNLVDVLCCYPGLHAIWLHRIAHFLWGKGLKFFARLLSHLARIFTGIEIHPGAEIGAGTFIDHGSGVVIGETAEVGRDVLIYQGVVLGGTSKEKGERHPQVEDRVELGAGAILLGPIEVGEGARIGAGSVVTRSVPAGATAVGVPAQTSSEREEREEGGFSLDHADIPDPLSSSFRFILRRQLELEKQLNQLKRRQEKMSKGNGGN